MSVIASSQSVFADANIDSVIIRSATINDIPLIRDIIRDSFLAMVEFHGEDSRESMEAAAKDSMDQDLTETSFITTYFSSTFTHFWVAENSEKIILGTVAIKHRNVAEADLVRMAVEIKLRGQGLGLRLFQVAQQFCLQTNKLRIHIVTANPRSKEFYIKCGALSVQTRLFSFKNGQEGIVTRLIRYLGDKIIRRVAVIGGTHGNERIGVELVKQFVRDHRSVQRSSFSTLTLLGNPEAVLEYHRFIDQDLNREFTGWMTTVETEASSKSYIPKEVHVAKILNLVLGPKAASSMDEVGSDFIIDLHSSTSNTGLVAMISGIDHDLFARRLAFYLQQEFPGLRVCSSTGGKDASYSLDSISPSGIAFEVGPLPHGLISPDLFEKSRQLVHKTLDYIEQHNMKLLSEKTDYLSSVREEAQMDGFQYSSGSKVCEQLVTSTVAPKSILPSTFPTMEYFIRVGQVLYPEWEKPINEQLIPSQLNSDAYYSALMSCKSHHLHPSLSGKDWTVIKDGDPLFIASDGTDDIITFDRKRYLFEAELASHNVDSEDLYTLFIAEAAYAPRNIALTLYKKVFDNVF